MKLTPAKILKYLAIATIAVLLSFFWPRRKKPAPEPEIRDYPEIVSEGKLRVLTEYNSISFYADGDSISGFDYELIRAFAREKGLEVEIIPEMSFRNRLEKLNDGSFDVIAYRMPLTSEWKDSLALTIPITRSKQILVQRKLDDDNSTRYIRSQLDLANETLYVEKGSPSILRIRNLENEIADTIFINEIEKYGQEQIIAMVAHRDIDYAVTDENIALALIDSFPQLDINTGISFTQLYAWGVNRNSPALLDTLNTWLTGFIETAAYQQLYRKYLRKP